MNVTAVEPKPGGDAGFVLFDDGSKAWTPERVKAEPLVGKPVPGDWTLKDGPYGKQLLPPKEGGGKTAWRNTKEGFLAEQEGRIRWQQVEQSSIARSVALKTAMEWYVSVKDPMQYPETLYITEVADEFYNWLTKSGGERRVETIAYGEGVIGSKATPPPDSTSAPRAVDRSVGIATQPNSAEIEKVQHGSLGETRLPGRVGADESSTGPAVAEAARGATPGDEGLVRQEATDPSSSGPVESTNHLHGPWSEKRPDGAPMRDGWLRCEGCGQASLRKSVA